MENHFMNLNWSWGRNFDRPDDATKQKNLNFYTIPLKDPFNRFLNEMNVNLIEAGGSTENSIFELVPETNSEPTDPRKKCQGCIGCLNHALTITNFQYNSRLSRNQHYVLFEKYLKELKDTTFNKNLIGNFTSNRTNSLSSSEMLELINKHETEMKCFQEFAENSFSRDIMELSENINDFFGQFAVEVWNTQLQQLTIHSNKYQSVTQIPDTIYSTINFQLSKLPSTNSEIGQLWMKEFSQVSRDFLPKLQPNITEITNFHKIQNSRIVDGFKCDAEDISFYMNATTVLSILSNEKESFVNFEISQDENYQKIVNFSQELPPISCELLAAVKLGIRTLLTYELELRNFSLFSNRNSVDSGTTTEIYKVQENDKILLEKFNKFLQMKSVEEIGTIWTIQGLENSKMLVTQKGHFYHKSENEFRPVFISVKLEFQIKFGFQSMTKLELLEEFVHSYFNNCLIYRYRVDMISLTVISLKVLEPVDIQMELERSHGVKVQSFINLLTCLIRLPQAKYLMHRRTGNDKEASKIVIFQETEMEADNLFDLNALYQNVKCEILNNLSGLKFIPIAKEISPLQLKFKLAPCSFPVQNKNRAYDIQTSSNKFDHPNVLSKMQKKRQNKKKKQQKKVTELGNSIEMKNKGNCT